MIYVVGGEHERRLSVLVREPGIIPAYICEGHICMGLK